jgi:hypothetical protein
MPCGGRFHPDHRGEGGLAAGIDAQALGAPELAVILDKIPG